MGAKMSYGPVCGCRCSGVRRIGLPRADDEPQQQIRNFVEPSSDAKFEGCFSVFVFGHERPHHDREGGDVHMSAS
jgi:hypothetical protein